ncbi:MAG: hypothetical protein K2H78_02910 [Clostridia bacterium]|nr:hypothetical protein [Clostridia bacterium]
MKFNWKDGKTLYFDTGLKGEWYVSGTLETLTISEVGNGLTAKVSYSAADGEYEFAYNPFAGTLTYVEAVNGIRTTTTISLAGEKSRNELSINRSGGTDLKKLSGLRVAEGAADSWRGTYTSNDGTSWTFDGLGKCEYGSGTATYFNGYASVSYKYDIDVLGRINITLAKLLFTEAQDGGFTKDGKTYKTIAYDAFYNDTAFVEVSGTRTWYYFDGCSILWKRTASGYEKAYEYKIISVYEMELTDINTGVKYKARMAQDGDYYGLTLTQI